MTASHHSSCSFENVQRERERESEMEKGLTGQVLIKEDFGNLRFFNERKKCFEKIEEVKYNGIDGIF